MCAHQGSGMQESLVEVVDDEAGSARNGGHFNLFVEMEGVFYE